MEKDLPKYVTRFTDNRGSTRLRFRRTSYPTYYFKSDFGTDRFNEEYAACLTGNYLSQEQCEYERARGLIANLEARDAILPECYIYAIGEIQGDAVKVGLARNVTKRLCTLQIGNPRTLRLFAIRPGTVADEKKAHTELRDHCIKGEWFRKPAVRRLFESDKVWLASPEVYLASSPQTSENKG